MFHFKTSHLYYMSSFKNLFFPLPPSPAFLSVLILIIRIVAGLLFLNHGIAKCIAYDRLMITFPDPLGVGSDISLILVIFAEVICSLGFILGILFRLCLIPMIFTMCIVIFVIHSGGSINDRELPILYLVLFVVLFFSGPGYFSLDMTFRELHFGNGLIM